MSLFLDIILTLLIPIYLRFPDSFFFKEREWKIKLYFSRLLKFVREKGILILNFLKIKIYSLIFSFLNLFRKEKIYLEIKGSASGNLSLTTQSSAKASLPGIPEVTSDFILDLRKELQESIARLENLENKSKYLRSKVIWMSMLIFFIKYLLFLR